MMSVNYSYSYKGEWEFSEDKEDLEVILDNEKSTWDISLLSSKEFQFEDQNGWEWELEAK